MDYTCPFCQQARSCDTCRRLLAYNVLVQVITEPMRLMGSRVPDYMILDGLDALAELMKQHAADRRRHQKEMNEEAREAQRGARDAYQQGREEATRDW